MSNESALIICLPPDQLMIVSVCSKVWTVHTAQPSTQTLDLGRLETGSAMSALMFSEDPLTTNSFIVYSKSKAELQ